MIWLYRLVYWPAFVLLLPKYMQRLWKRGGKWRLGERCGFIHPPAKKEGVSRLWLHAVSVGELNAIRKLLAELKNNPGVEVCLSVTTTTARALAEEKLKGLYAYLFTFPLDNFCTQTLKRLNPDMLALVDGELWPELLHQAKKRRLPVYLINARLSDRSFARLRLIRWAAKRLLSKLSLILAATKQDAERFLALGANPELVAQIGSLKFDAINPQPLSEEKRAELLASLRFSAADRIVVGSSTWPGEEAFLINAYKALKAEIPGLKLLLVPRHAERGGEVEALLKQSGVAYHRRSTGPVSGNPEIVLADTTGELATLSQLGSLVFIGKSLVPPREGQNPIEAAAFGKPILMGYGMSNFRQIAQSLVDARGGTFVGGPTELREALRYLLTHEAERAAMGRASLAWFEQNRGATLRTLEWLELLPEAVGMEKR